MRLLAAIQPPDVTQAILDCLELPRPGSTHGPGHPRPQEMVGDFETSL